MQRHEIALVEFRKTHPLGLVGRNLRILKPGATGVLIKIHTGIDGLVEIVNAETGRRFRLRSSRSRGLRQAEASTKSNYEKNFQDAHDNLTQWDDEQINKVRRISAKNVSSKPMLGQMAAYNQATKSLNKTLDGGVHEFEQWQERQ